MKGKIIIIGIVICLLTLSFSGCIGDEDSKKYTKIKELTGIGAVATDSFTISGEKWKVKWNKSYDSDGNPTFYCNVCPVGGDQSDTVASIDRLQGEKVIDTGKDDFYFIIDIATGIDSWTFIIYDYI